MAPVPADVAQAAEVVVAAAAVSAPPVAAAVTAPVQARAAYKRQPSNPGRRKARQPVGNVA
jgi:hypothetical protein